MRLWWEQAPNTHKDLAVLSHQAAVRLQHFKLFSWTHPDSWVKATKIGLGCCSVIHLLHMLAASRWALGLPLGEEWRVGLWEWPLNSSERERAPSPCFSANLSIGLILGVACMSLLGRMLPRWVSVGPHCLLAA